MRSKTIEAAFGRGNASKERLGLIGVLLLAIALRLYRITGQSLWIDEIYSVTDRGSYPIHEILFASTLDSHPPLHYVLVHLWVYLFGNSVLSVRLHAVVLGIAGVIAIYALGKTLFNGQVGLLSAFLLAISPMHLDASREVRMYGLLVLLTIASLYTFVKLIKNRSYGNIGAYVVTTILLLLTHPYSIFVIIAQNAYVASGFITNSKHTQLPFSFTQWSSLQLATGALALPGLFRMLELAVGLSTGATEGWVHWITPPNVYVVLETFIIYSGYPDFYPYLVDLTVSRWAALLVLFISVNCIGIAFGEFKFWRSRRDPNEQQVDGFYLLLLLLVSVIVLPYIISHLLRPIYVLQSTILGVVPFYLLVAFGISEISSERLRTVLMIMLVVGLSLSAGIYLTTDTQEPFQEVVSDVDSQAVSDDLVVLHPNYIQNSYDYYRSQNDVESHYETVTYTEEFRPEEADQLRSRAADHDRIWIVSREKEVSEPVLEVVSKSHELQSSREEGNLYVYQFERSDESETANRLEETAANETTQRTTAQMTGSLEENSLLKSTITTP